MCPISSCPDMTNPLISIIIPVYNAEEYIRKCLDSVLNQGLDDYEVLLVNDGSKDGSVGICEEYCRKNPHFRLLHQENAGVSAARNHGLSLWMPMTICWTEEWLLPSGA